MRRTLNILATLVTTSVLLTACSGVSSGNSSDGRATTVDITVKDGTVTPSGDRVKVGVGETVTLNIDADTSGEIHVHSTPEQELAYEEGTSTEELTIDHPGIVDLEDHELDQVIVQLEVS